MRVTTLGLCGLMFLVGGLVLVGCTPSEQIEAQTAEMSREEERAALGRPDPAGEYGQKLVADSPTPISELVLNASDFQGENVRIEGVIEEVCPMRGCWLDIADDTGQTMRVKVTDGVIVFPKSSVGHRASIEGTLIKIEYDAEQAMAYRAHQAEELGLSFDPETAEQGPMVIWQLDGKGAVIG